MPTLVINNVPEALFDRIQLLARSQHQAPADAALQVLETALDRTIPPLSEAPLPQPPFLTEDIIAPVNIPWPEGKVVHGVRVSPPLPTAHDLPDKE